MQNLSHEGRQLRHERLVAVVLAHVRQHDGPEWHRQQDLAPRDRRRLLGIYIGLKKDSALKLYLIYCFMFWSTEQS